MPRIYKLSKTGLKLLYKIRHHRGHGIHSPFVFNLITKVIEEKTPYHAYEDVKQIINNESDRKQQTKLDKINLLCFRLINYFEAIHILEIGSGYGINTLCLTAPSTNIECICVEESQKKSEKAKLIYKGWDRNIRLYTQKELPILNNKQDCIYIDLNHFNDFGSDITQYLSIHLTEKSFIIVKGIRTNKTCQTLWRSIMNMESRTAVLDLFNLGIVFFDSKLYRWSYQISF